MLIIAIQPKHTTYMPETLEENPSTLPDKPYSGNLDYVDEPELSLGDFLSRIGLEGLSPENRLELIERATVGDFMAAINAIHHKVAPEDSHEPQPEQAKFSDSQTGDIHGFATEPEEREAILEHALSAAKQVVQKYREDGGSLDNTLQRCGDLAAFGIVLAHYYKDGNGRAARTIAELVYKGFDSKDPESIANLNLVSASRPRGGSGFAISTYLPTGDWSNGRANENPMAFLDVVAALDKPLDEASYTSAARAAFMTPRIGYQH